MVISVYKSDRPIGLDFIFFLIGSVVEPWGVIREEKHNTMGSVEEHSSLLEDGLIQQVSLSFSFFSFLWNFLLAIHYILPISYSISPNQSQTWKFSCSKVSWLSLLDWYLASYMLYTVVSGLWWYFFVIIMKFWIQKKIRVFDA